MAYLQSIPVRFEHVDYARIVFYPRLFEYCHWTFEDFFAREVGVPYARMLGERKVGFPTVHAEADFKAPLRFGDVCEAELSTLRVSSKSITCQYRLLRDEGRVLCATLQVVTVAVDMDSFKPLEVPDDVRQAFLRHLASP
jgi:4-hydroxybenzoyl-CoA thioesterase